MWEWTDPLTLSEGPESDLFFAYLRSLIQQSSYLHNPLKMANNNKQHSKLRFRESGWKHLRMKSALYNTGRGEDPPTNQVLCACQMHEADMGWESVGSELHETFFTSDEVVVAAVVTQVGM